MQSMIIGNQLYISPSISPRKDQPELLQADLKQLANLTKSRVDSRPPIILAGSSGVVLACVKAEFDDDLEHEPSAEILAEEFPFELATTAYGYISIKSKTQHIFRLCALTPHFHNLLQSYLNAYPQFKQLQVVPVVPILIYKNLNPSTHHQFFVVSWNGERAIVIAEHGGVVAVISYENPADIVTLLHNYLYSTEKFDVTPMIEAFGVEAKELEPLPKGWTFTAHKFEQRNPFDLKVLRGKIPLITVERKIDQPVIATTTKGTSDTHPTLQNKPDDDLTALKWILPIVAILGFALGMTIRQFLL